MSSSEFPSAEMELFASIVRPYDEWSALMVGEEWIERGEVLLDLIGNTLSERELYVLNAIVFERTPLRLLGYRMSLSKTHVARIRDEALARIRSALVVDVSEV